MSGPLNHSAAQIVANLLIDAMIGSTKSAEEDWPVHYDGRPDTPDDIIQVVENQGITQGRIHNTGHMVERYGIQVLVRGMDRHLAYRKAAEIVKFFDEEVRRDTVEVDGLGGDDEPSEYMVHAINRTSAVIKAGMDGRRQLFSINALGSITMTLDGTLGTGS